uniref:SDR family oxidoreductase n=1 Tax=Roseihalotalea indica TaxID=2867963 RepID=A0AA49JIS5_9BACT|nr:SDR family oxidoreductase [Tunicatimonas sp. TK19036]
MQDNIAQPVVVITGASAGVGRAAAREFAKNGYQVALLARSEAGLEGARQDVEALGGKALAIPVDVSDQKKVEAAAQQIEDELGLIDVWVNNAMQSVFSPFDQMTPEEFKYVVEVTFMGQVYGTMAALKRMKPRNRGTIIMVGSALAFRGIPLQSAYCASKHAVKGFFDSVRSELVHDNSDVQLTMVHLSAINTTQFNWVKSRLPKKGKPMGKVYQPEVAARAIYSAANQNRRTIFVGSGPFQTALGNTFIPGMLDRLLAKTGYSGQQTDQPEDPDRPDNLWEPINEDRGAHGSFDDKASEESLELQVSTNRGMEAAVVAGTALGVAGLVYLLRNS